MGDLKLGKLPDRIPVKLTITIAPSLQRALQAYAELYRETYGQAEPVTELIPYMLESFLASDRSYAKALKNRPDGAARVDGPKSTRRKQRLGDASPPES
ncbi:hypothetical protein SAMN02745126_04449 [Enhydrobacter aerosaccus]|uniref:DUF2274 domain-containing protein n=1 Tax=Enhydrobacter aerosaccus TaxID=225324 RepID=A0A1T4S9E4_9HYPH|nr:DUF2274 domain-containing protein [Enhydrobacter aerosaccus]SKA24825.1 hypothetical protein SAMN02745126_04449 [Enhydrobacter aerosaccus]